MEFTLRRLDDLQQELDAGVEDGPPLAALMFVSYSLEREHQRLCRMLEAIQSNIESPRGVTNRWRLRTRSTYTHTYDNPNNTCRCEVRLISCHPIHTLSSAFLLQRPIHSSSHSHIQLQTGPVRPASLSLPDLLPLRRSIVNFPNEHSGSLRFG